MRATTVEMGIWMRFSMDAQLARTVANSNRLSQTGESLAMQISACEAVEGFCWMHIQGRFESVSY